MKKLLLLFSIIFLGEINAQITFPMPGADWHYEVENFSFFGPSTFANREVKYTHDTLILGRAAKVLTNLNYYNYCSPANGNVYFYSSNDSVFFYNSETLNKWQLLYSFNTPVGQSWQFLVENSTSGIDTINVKVDSVKFTVINSISLKTLFVTYTEKNPSILPYHSVIYDRIGDITYLFNFVPNIYGLCDGGQKFKGVLCYSDSTFTVYQPDTAKSCNYVQASADIQNNNNAHFFEIYPNPASGQFTVKTNSQEKLSVSLFDINGKQVLSVISSQTQSNEIRIDISNLNEGVYTLAIKTDSGVEHKRLVIVR